MNSSKVQLTLQTSSLVAGFMAWVLISSLMPSIKQDIALTNQQVALVTAVPVILGSVLRVPLGYYTNKLGARITFTVSFIILLFPVFFLSTASSYIDLIIGGLFLGLGGAIFSIGVTSLPKYYPQNKHGLVNGIYGAGNIGTAVTAFSAPVLANMFGWMLTIRIYLVIIITFAVLNFIFGDKDEKRVNVPIQQQLATVYKNTTLWALCLFYFITFGSFVAFTIYLPNFLSTNFGLSPADAGLRTAGFIVLSTFLRPLGGWLSDRFNPFMILAAVFSGLTFAGVLLSFSPTLTLYSVGVLTVASCAGIGNGTVFKLVPHYFTNQAGIVNGIVAAIGGLGGFFPPLVLSTVFGITGHYSIGFMALSEFSLASLIIVLWMFFHEKLRVEAKILEGTSQGMMITDKSGVIQKVNAAFTEVTGYEPDEVIGERPNILRSGNHEPAFYEEMWHQIKDQGYWQGEIWNKRKGGEDYPEWLTINSVKNDSNEIVYYVGQFNDLSRESPQSLISHGVNGKNNKS